MIRTDLNTPATRLGNAIAITLAILLSPGLAAAGLSPQDSSPKISQIADFNKPWAMAFLPDGRLLVTEKQGKLILMGSDGALQEVENVPEVAYGGQGGLGDVVLHPEFESNGLVYLSFVEAAGKVFGAAVASAKLELRGSGAALTDLEVIWRQTPKVTGRGHYGHRIAFGPDGYLWISSGDRQKFDPSQDMGSTLGKIVRLHDDGSVPVDNPWVDSGGVTAQIWSSGHRNPLGLAFDDAKRLWVVEMGPAGGDELNLVEKGVNYGYPIVSNGNHYDGRDIPDHDQRPDLKPPAITWTPVISPASLMFYSGSEFPDWRGSAFVAGMSSKGLVRIVFQGEKAVEAQRISLGARVRDVTQAPDGSLWVLEDDRGSSKGRLLRLTK